MGLHQQPPEENPPNRNLQGHWRVHICRDFIPDSALWLQRHLRDAGEPGYIYLLPARCLTLNSSSASWMPLPV
jgi:hypothetical protein